MSISPAEIIAKTRDGIELNAEEINYLVSGYVSGKIPDYQMSSWLMAACIRGLSERETFLLTTAMIASGKTLDLSGISGVKVDKHSTGGVGDKTTLVLVPLLAASGLKVAKMSGRGLGHTGGTIDKLESIPGCRTELSIEEFVAQVNNIGAAVISQTEDIVPADKKIYALRDVTATVESIPLIASSIMSKKLAAGADFILLDVKYGSGAFMANEQQAMNLAEVMISIGKSAGKKVIAVLSDMNDVLGRAVGNILEVEEAIRTLQGRGPEDLRNLCIELGSALLQSVGITKNKNDSVDFLVSLLDNGKAASKFDEIILAQGGDLSSFLEPEKSRRAVYHDVFQAERSGFIFNVDVRQIGLAALDLGAGRTKKDDILDYQAGLVVQKKVGDAIRAGDILEELYTSSPDATAKFLSAKNRLKNAYNICRNKPVKSNNNIKIMSL